MATKSRSKSTSRSPKSSAKVVSNRKTSTAASLLNRKWAGPLIALVVIIIGTITLVWTQAATTTHTMFGNTTPKKSSESDSRSVELGVKFRAQYAGQITGLRFYKSAQNTGTHVGNLWTKDGKLLARATFRNEKATGWQQVTFNKPVEISANTTYVASYFAPKGHFARDVEFFAKEHKSGPLTGLKSGLDGLNGVYRYSGTTTFPGIGAKAKSNYYIDVVYSTSRFNPTPKPNAPTNLVAAAKEKSVGLAWKASTTTSIGQYRILRDGNPIGTVPTNITTYNDTNVTTGSTYTYTVVAVDTSNNSSVPSNSVKATIPKAPTPTPTPTPTPPPAANGPRGKSLYRDTRLEQDGRVAAISGQPYSVWIGGWSGDPAATANRHTAAAAAQGKIAQFILYNIPLRDCGHYSAGGLSNFTEYRQWIDGVAAGIGQREAIVVIEPDALAAIDCLTTQQRNDRIAGLSYAATALATRTKAHVYMDAGNATWMPSGEMANRLKQVGIDKIRGFALNISNFHPISQNTTYGSAISAGVGGKPFVVDTSRNGRGAYANANEPEGWCNPPGRGLGVRPTTTTGHALIDAYLWGKTPGESDGPCRGAPPAGQWFESYAQELVRNANYNAQ